MAVVLVAKVVEMEQADLVAAETVVDLLVQQTLAAEVEQVTIALLVLEALAS